MKKQWLPLSLAVVGVAVEVIAFCCYQRSHAPAGRPSLIEVASLAKEKGLCVRGDRGDGSIAWRLFVSEQPLSHVAASMLLYCNTAHARWRGIVAVSVPWGREAEFYDPDDFVLWKGFLIFGDRELIGRLTGRSSAGTFLR